MNLAYGQGGLNLEINIPPQHISAKSKRGLIIEGGEISSEYGVYIYINHSKEVYMANILPETEVRGGLQ